MYLRKPSRRSGDTAIVVLSILLFQAENTAAALTEHRNELTL
jgi:hypothetical protein